MKPVIAVSVGDVNGVGFEIILKAHSTIKEWCTPLYFTNYEMLKQAATLLNLPIPKDIEIEYIDGDFKIKPGKVSAKSGAYSFRSFQKALNFTEVGVSKALVTLPIHKKAWEKAKLPYKGHTHYIATHFNTSAIMMLGGRELFVALFTEHIPLKKVAKRIKKKPLTSFLYNFYTSQKPSKVGVLGLNPHAGDGGVLGDEEKIIKKAIQKVNKRVGKEVFVGPLVPDIAFTPHLRKKFNYLVAMYHDQGLAPLKALYFDEAINVTLNIPILRTSVDHGTAFDIAYKNRADPTSFINAVKFALTSS